MMNFDFTDKTVFVTGAASGIGTTQAQAFLKGWCSRLCF